MEKHEVEAAELRRALEKAVSECRQLEKLNEEAYTLLMIQSCGDNLKAPRVPSKVQKNSGEGDSNATVTGSNSAPGMLEALYLSPESRVHL